MSGCYNSDRCSGRTKSEGCLDGCAGRQVNPYGFGKRKAQWVLGIGQGAGWGCKL